MKTNILRYLYFANLVTSLGTAMIFIPVGNVLSAYLGIGGAFSLLLVLAKAPLALFANSYARIGRRYGAGKTIAVSQAMATILAGVSVVASSRSSTPLLILGLTGTAISGAILPCLFPAFLHQQSESVEQTERFFSHWYFIQHLALMVSTLFGAYLEAHVSITIILALDGLTFFINALFWITLASSNIEFPSAFTEGPPIFGFFSHLSSRALRLQIVNFSRNIFYGFINPILPVLVLQHLGGNSIRLAYLYLVLGTAALLGAQCASKVRIRSNRFLRLHLVEVSLLCVGLLAESMEALFTFASIAIVLMAINEIKLQAFFFETQPKASSIASSSAFEQTVNTGALIGYAAYNLVPNSSTKIGLLGFAAGLIFVLFGAQASEWRAEVS